MPALIIVEVDIHDHELYEEYKTHTPGTLEDFGGRFVVRGAETESLEGNWNPKRLVVIEFPSVIQAKKWWSSPKYDVAKDIRHRAAKTKMLVVETV